MNRIYRLVWSHVTNGWVPVSELARGRGKRASRRLAATTLALTAAAAQAGPSGGQVVAGSGVITQSGSTTTVAQSSQNLSVNWVSFNIAPQETVNFLQPSASSIAINRIFDPNGTQILGHLNANGQVYLINPNGVLFGAGAQVNVGGLVASTLDVNDATLADSQRTFKGGGSGSVINQGTITAANGGYVALLGNHVSNQGTISAQLGTVALGAGSAVTLTYSKNNLVQVQVDQSVLNNEAENGGLVAADGGKVIMTAGARNALLASAVNNTGVIEARTVENQEGSVTLLGGMAAGTVNVGGTIDASAPNGGNGGQIETSAANVNIAPNAKVTTAAAQGLYGSWLIDPSDFTVASSGGNETGGALSSALGSGNVTLQSSSGSAGGSGNVNINDTVSWSANTTLTLTASNNVNVNASVTASGATAGIAINPNTANGSETPSGSGIFSLGNGGVINLPNVSASSTAALRIGGASYTVINSLGAAGSVTGTDLQGMRGALAKNYALGSNINASATSGWNSGAGFTPIGVASGTPSSATDFTGIFDGLGHTITGLTINNSSVNGGLFAAVSGTVRNVGMVGGSISAGGYSGGLVGELNYGTVSNSYATGNVSAPNVQGLGGLVGWMNDGTVKNSYATGNVTASSVSGSLSNGIGGLVGGMQGGLVTNSHATGAVSGGESVGGLVGYMYAGPVPGGSTPRTATVSNSYATGAVTGNFSVGGLVGCSYGFGAAATVSNSYATGNVTGVTSPAGAPSAFLGGLMGHNYGGYGSNVATVSNSYATGNVTGYQYVGGLIGGNAGFASGGIVNDSYSTGQVSLSSGGSGSGGLIGDNSNYNVGDPGIAGTISNSYWNLTTSAQGTSAGGSGLTSGQMLVQSSFNSWNFSANGTWVKYSGTDPLLIADMTAATVTATAASRTYDGTAYSGGNGVTVTETINGLTSTVTASLTGLTYAGTSQGAVNAGSYVITPSGLSSNQQGYYFTYGSGTLTVNPRALNGSITAGSSVYGSALTPGTVSFTNAVAGNVPTATVSVDTTGHSSTSSHLNAGSYTGIETVTALSGGTDSGDYTIGTITGNYTVTPLALTGSIAAGSSTYGSALSPGAASLSGAVAGDILGTATVSVNTTGNTSTGSHLNAGSYTGIESVTGLSGADGGNYTFAGVTGNYTVGKLALTGSIAAGSSVYGSALAPGALSFTNAAAGDVVTGGSVSVNTTGNTSTSGNLKAGSYTGIESAGSTLGGADAANYTFAGATGDYTVSKLTLSGSIAAGSSVYGAALAPGAVTLTNVIAGDVVTGGSVSVDTTGNTSTSGNLKAGSYTGIESVTALTGADSGNYSLTALTGNYTVSKLALTGSIGAGTSVYGAALAPGATTFTNVISGDVVSGSVSVNTTGITSTSGNLRAGSYTGIEAVTGLTGADGGNYTVASAVGNYTVTPLTIAVTAIGANKVYDGTVADSPTLSSAGLISGDLVSFSDTSATFVDKNVGTGKAVSVSGITASGADVGNYVIGNTTATTTADITPLTITVAATANSKVYDGSTTAAVALSGGLAGDSLTFSDTAANFSNPNAGTSKVVTVSGISVGGADAADYTLSSTSASTTGSITPATLTVSAETANNKVYDGTVAATLSGGNLVGVIAGDSVSLNGAGSFTSKDVGTGIAVTPTDTLSGTSASNYVLSQPTGLSASITPATLTYIATPTTLIAGLTPSGLGGSVSGFVASDTLANATTGALAWNTPAASGSPAGHYAIDGGGLSATNYVFVQDADNATALTLVPGTPPQSVINELATLDGNFTSSAPVATRLDDNQHSFSLQVIDGGVRLPDDRSNAN